MAIPDVLKPVFEWIDVSGQSFGVNVVYRWETLFLPTIACALVVIRRKGSGWTAILWVPLFWAATIAVVIYLLLYRMHWYSWVAFPVMILSFGFLLLRWRWYWAVNPRSYSADLLPNTGGFVRQLGQAIVRRLWNAGLEIASHVRHPGTAWKGLAHAVRSAPLKTLLTVLRIAAVALGIWLALQITDTSLGFWLILLLAAISIIPAGFIIVRVADCGRRFRKYVRSDPRMSCYLDAVRSIRARGGRAAASFLSRNRLEDPDLAKPSVNRWANLFRISQLPGIRHILMILAHREPMPTIRSAFILQHLEHTRQETWREYASARFGRWRNERAKDPLTAYLDRIREHGGMPHPPEFDNAGLRRLRVSWLAMTEAMAECHFFSKSRTGKKTRAPLNLLKAAELLGQAGEVQHQITRELVRYHRKRHGPDLNENLHREIRLAVHFLDLAARCIENWLEPGEQKQESTLSLLDRYGRFCSPIFDGKSFAGSLLEHRLRQVLAMRYRLMAHLRLLLPAKEQTPNDRTLADTNNALGSEPAEKEADPHVAFESAMAQLACDGAFAALHIERCRGSMVRLRWTTGQQASVGAFAVLGSRVGKAVYRAQQCGEPAYRAKTGGHHVWQLAGLALEQEMENLRQGDRVWQSLCESAARAYEFAESSRIRLIWATAQTPPQRGPGEPPNSRPSGGPRDIITLD